MKSAAKYYRLITGHMQKISLVIMGWATIAIFLVIIVQVFFRYILRTSLGGAEELPPYIMALAIWLSVPVTTIQKRHIRIDLVPNLLKGKAREYLVGFTQLIAFLAMAVYAKLAFEFVRTAYGHGEVSGGLGIPLWTFHVVIAVCALLVAFYSLMALIDTIGRITKC
ncbi:MAG: TRAP transporter small permease [Clostridiales Family XIII bacterium]|jgi:C4-dicarboxylate transporter DctQ subunit|nr:TRAP transporter small permease [Clostridiales Family XIII bacterium]